MRFRELLLINFGLINLTSADHGDGTNGAGFNRIMPHGKSTREPCLLTPYIVSGELALGRNLSRVVGLEPMKNVESYAGFFTINETHNSNMFFWYFPAEVSIRDECLKE